MSERRSGNIIELRGSGREVASLTRNISDAMMLRALLRRSKPMFPRQGTSVVVAFDTAVEAEEFQRLLHSLGRRRKRKASR